MIKLLGALLVFLAASAYGFLQSRRLIERPRHIRMWTHALQQLETEIVYGATPLPEAVARLGRRTKPPVSYVLDSIAQRLREHPEQSFSEAWQFAMQQHKQSMAIQGPECEVLERVGGILGLSDREDQTKHLRLAVTNLQYEESLASEDQQRYANMWKTLGVLAGALIVLLMY